MSNFTNRQFGEFTAFFEAVAEGISENDRGTRAMPKPVPPPALNPPALLDSMRALLAEELRNHAAALQPQVHVEHAVRAEAEAVVAKLANRIQELEVDAEQQLVQRERLQRQLDSLQVEHAAAQLKQVELEDVVATLNSRLLQARNEYADQQSHGDSLRLEFARKLEANETELKRLLLAADERLRTVQQQFSEEREVHVQALTSERAAHVQALAGERAAHVQALTSERAAHAQALGELQAQLNAEASKKRSGPSAFLSALPTAPSSTPAAAQARVLVAPQARNAPAPEPRAPFAPPPSAAEIEREKHRLAVLALGTEVAPAKLYFQLLPWQGLKSARVSIPANTQATGTESLAAFAVAAATQQAIASSRGHSSIHLVSASA